MIQLTEAQKHAIWSVLVETCAARARQWDEFAYHFPQCGEFRFQGNLGFGGKVWADRRRVYVDCYPEDETAERRVLIESANVAIAAVIDNEEGAP